MSNFDLKNYNGGKGSSGTYQKIINAFPKHSTFYELFAGSAKLTRKKKTADLTILLEKNSKIYSQLDFQFENNDSIVVFDADAFDWIKCNLLKRLPSSNWETLIYIDPPYLHSTRKDINLYGSDYELSDDQHKELLTLCNQLSVNNFMVCISTYPNKLYDRMLKDWHYIEFNSTTRHGTAVERLYFNYSYPIWNKHEFTYAGDNYREREIIKNKAERYMNKFRNMPELQRAVIANALCENKLIKL